MKEYRFGDLVQIQRNVFKIKKDKLEELNWLYGKCLSENQLRNIIGESDYDDKGLILTPDYFYIKDTHTQYGIIIGENKSFNSFYCCTYGEYTKFTPSTYSYPTIVIEKSVLIDKVGKDFSDIFYETLHIEKLIEDEDLKKTLVSSSFYNKI